MTVFAPVGAAPDAFDVLCRLLHGRAGIVLTRSKQYLVESRLQPIMRRHGAPDLAGLTALLASKTAGSDRVASDIVEAMTTNETFFFRDDKPFQHLRHVSLPALHARRPREQALRIWSAASSSGQEAFSVAMILADLDLFSQRPVEVVGTDISLEQVERAATGLYSDFEVKRGLPASLLARHFEQEAGGWRVGPALRKRITFRQWNLLHDPAPLGRFDIILCRNVLIYFDQPTKTGVLKRLAGCLRDDGYLYLGGAETILGLDTPFVAKSGEVAFRLAGG